MVKLTEQDAKAPYVDGEAVPALGAEEHLGSSVSESAAVGGGSELLLMMQNFWEAEVYHFDVALFIYHHIFWFDVSVYHVVPLECFKRAEYLTGIELTPTFLAVFAQHHIHLILYHPVQILPRQIFKDEINILKIGKGLF